jgi:hypothetical protein
MSLIKKIDDDLKGQPDTTITYILIGVAILATLIAVYGSPLLKVTAAIWFIAP